MKKLVPLIIILFVAAGMEAQQNYTDFERIKLVRLEYKSGRIDMKARNPLPNEVNSSNQCARYHRASSVLFDNIKFFLDGKMENVALFASYGSDALKIKLKVYTSAPPGTIIEIQLGKFSNLNYPMSVHSQYQAVTTKQDEWEELEFTFSQKPKGSIVKAAEIDQINILFAPNTKTNHNYFFDDLIGPMLIQKNISTGGKNQKP
ncbi:MAG: hypothetical protein H0X62_10785 [Bacteroidetes bacterium]|nr:hypothetical protein [Bacteroidota bacterium]